jgi:hypothetical protein
MKFAFIFRQRKKNCISDKRKTKKDKDHPSEKRKEIFYIINYAMIQI